jgi:[acyl-carrier-protein] S-malonyltransferase
MAGEGVNHLIECGPGKVLVGLNKRIEKSMAAEAVFDPASLDAALGQ